MIFVNWVAAMIDNNYQTGQEVLCGEFFELLAQACAALGEGNVLATLAVHRTTLLRWRTGQARIPAAVRALVEVMATGRPPQMSATRWGGFRFTEAAIIAPDGREFTPNGLMGFFWVEQLMESHKRRIAVLEMQLAALMAERDTANDPIERPGVTMGQEPLGPAVTRARRRVQG